MNLPRPRRGPSGRVSGRHRTTGVVNFWASPARSLRGLADQKGGSYGRSGVNHAPTSTDMYAVHGVFRDTLGAAPTLVGDIAPGDAERVDQIGNYYDNILYFLEAHHDGEEVIVFPPLRERCPGEEALLDSLESSTRRPCGCSRMHGRRWRSGRVGTRTGAQAAVAGAARGSLRAQLVDASRRGRDEGAAAVRGEHRGRGVGCPPGHGSPGIKATRSG